MLLSGHTPVYMLETMTYEYSESRLACLDRTKALRQIATRLTLKVRVVKKRQREAVGVVGDAREDMTECTRTLAFRALHM